MGITDKLKVWGMSRVRGTDVNNEEIETFYSVWPGLGSQNLEDCKFEALWGFLTRPCYK